MQIALVVYEYNKQVYLPDKIGSILQQSNT